MYQGKKKRLRERLFCQFLAASMVLSGITVWPDAREAAFAAEEKIQIESVEDLEKIGKDSRYPMNGDYELAADLDLNGINWTPIGGSYGPEYGLVSGERVFSGTFDGKGHVIDGLTIDYDGRNSGANTNASALFAMIGSDAQSDYAEVKNLQFTNVDITHTLGSGDVIGTLAGEVNGFVKVENIAVLNGAITVNGGITNNGKSGDLIGVGGIVGQTRTNTSAAQISHLYNAASVTVSEDVANEQPRCGGIIGRIHQNSVIGSLTSAVNKGEVLFKGNLGYAVNGCSEAGNTGAAANTSNIINCFYLDGSGEDMGASTAKTEAELNSQTTVDALGGEYWTLQNGALALQMSLGVALTPIPSPEFAQGDRASSVTKDFTLPLSFVSEEGEETITWESDNEAVVSIDLETGIATAHGVLTDTQVTLTARSSRSGRVKTVKVTVVSRLEIAFDREYAKPGVEMTAQAQNAPEGTVFSYRWLRDKEEVSQTDSYTPAQSDLNQFLTAQALIDGKLAAEKRIYCSKLPVVYIDTDDGYGITSKTEYKSASMHVQGNDVYNSGVTALYDGGISIRGRGNSTWNAAFSKLPYKIKLDKKTDLMGFGVSKHWALLANFMDESLIRNTTSYDLSGKMGMTYLKSAHVELIFNGTYAGNYQLVGNVRIDEGRVDIHDWEDTAGDVAKAIAKAEKANGTAVDQDALEDYLNQNMQWITSDSAVFGGKTYKISDYFTDIPKTKDGKIDVSGGFLFELDTYYDEVSKFMTKHSQPIMFKNPEFAYPTIGSGYENPSITENNAYQNCDALSDYAREYMQALEDSIHSTDFYTEVEKKGTDAAAASFSEDYEGRRHYTDLVDLDSLVRYLMINELYWNTETMKKSTYMYKDLGKKLFIGPVWDMDWTSNSIVSQGETSNYSVWMMKTAASQCQSESWYRYLIADPYFVEKFYECYQENRQNFEDIVKTGGVIDQDKEYLAESAQMNYAYGFLQHRSDFETETERLKTFLKNRLDWLDRQFADYSTLLHSLGAYQASDAITVTADTADASSTTYTALVKDDSIKKVGFYINGRLADTVAVTAGKAELTLADREYLERKSGAANIVLAREMDQKGGAGSVSNYARFEKEAQKDILTGTVTIKGNAVEGSVLTAQVSDDNHTGELSYQWKADQAEISGATAETYVLTALEVGKSITVEVRSSEEEGSIESEPTEKVAPKPEVKNDHLLIHQVYGGGGKGDTAVSHSFIELYNPTDAPIRLDGYSVSYRSNRNADAPVFETLELGDVTVLAHTSYLIRCREQETTTAFSLTIPDSGRDIDWDVEIDNKQYQILLLRGTEKIDGVSVVEEAVEGEAIPDKKISKQKAIRRIDFTDTDNNALDFEIIEYQGAGEEALAMYAPRCSKDGVWPDQSNPQAAISGKAAIRGNAIVGAMLYAEDGQIIKADSADVLAYQWCADDAAISGANTAFYKVTKADKGKKISLAVSSSNDPTCSLTAQMDAAVREVGAQREHLIINQAYGSGGKKTPPVSHSFIELYNPTSKNIDLSGYQIKYASNGNAAALDLEGKVAAGASYLIQGAASENADGFAVTVANPDQIWENQVIDNKQYSVILEKDGVKVDGVSVNEAAVEGDPLVNPQGDEIISKNKAVRRIGFIDTDQNTDDFEVINYDKLSAQGHTDLIEEKAPRSGKDGKWGLSDSSGGNPDDPDQPEKPDAKLIGQVNALLNDAAKKKASDYTAASWKKLQNEVANAKNALKSGDNEKIKKAYQSLSLAVRTLVKVSSSGGSNQKPSGSSNQKPQENKIPKPGTKFQYKNGWYQVLTSSASGGTAKYLRPLKKTYQTVVVLPVVVEQNLTFKVTEINAGAMKGNKKLKKAVIGKNVTKIGASAFSGCRKLKTIVVESTKLKTVGENALKGVWEKCKIKVPKSKVKKYGKKFRKKGQKSSVKVVKK